MSNRNDWMTNEKPINKYVTIANDTQLSVKHTGNVQLKLKVDDSPVDTTIDDALYVPELFTNLLSVSRLVRKGLTVTFDGNGCRIINKQNEVITTGSLVGDVFKLDQWKTIASPAVSSDDKKKLWHRRLGHLGHDNLCKLNNNIVVGVNFKSGAKKPCEICIKGKQSRLPFSDSNSRTSEILELVHSDVSGKLPESFSGYRYFLTFIDDFSRKVFIYFLKYKSETFEKFKNFRTLVENQTGKKIKKFRSDNGGEYFGTDFNDYLTGVGIHHQSSAPCTPE